MNFDITDDRNYPLVWAVIPTWNRCEDLVLAVKSLINSDYPNLKVIIVDNASTDASVHSIQTLFEQVDLIQLGKNKGASFASNRGIEHALFHGAEYVLRMDSDIELSPEAISRMVAYAEQQPQAGMIFPKVMRADNPKIIWFKGSKFHPLYLIKGGKTHNIPDYPTSHPEEMDFVASATILLSRKSLQDVGLFDEMFFVYGEDSDLCLRYRRLGYKIIWLPNAVAWHKIGSENVGEFSVIQRFKGFAIFYLKNSKGIHRVFLLWHLLLWAMLRSTFRKPIINFRYAIKGILQGLKVAW